MIDDRISTMKAEIALLETIKEVQVKSVVNVRTDVVFDNFVAAHPDVNITRKRFSRLVCAELGLKVVQATIDGRRCYIYERN